MPYARRWLYAVVLFLFIAPAALAVYPDFSLVKTNNVNSSTPLTGGQAGWTWTFTLTNHGDGPATLSGNVIVDDLPNSANISYGIPAVTTQSGISGTITCSIVSIVTSLRCTTSGSSTFAVGSTLVVTLAATATSSGAYANPRNVNCYTPIFATYDGENTPDDYCADTVTVTSNSADLSIAKTNNVAGQSYSSGNWTWKLVATNSAGAGAAANFAMGATIITDDLPDANATYGTIGVTTGDGTTGTVNCSVTSSTLTCTATSAVSMPAGGTITVNVPTTANAEQIYTNPRSGGVCKVDPGNAVAESNENDNTCSPNSVTTIAADMVVAKTNNVGGSTSLSNPDWTWSFAIQNVGTLSKTYNNGTDIFFDYLPNTNITYDPPDVSLNGNVSGSVNCAVNAFILKCTATNSLVFSSGGIATVTLTAHASATGSYVNPRSVGQCYVSGSDGTPNDANTSDDTCSNTVTVTSPLADLSATKTNNVNGQSYSGGHWTWTIVVGNSSGAGAAAAFSNGDTILTDSLPNTGITYGTVGTTLGGGTTGTVNCSITSFDLTCTATSAVSIPASGTITVTIPATAATEAIYANPRGGGGVCKVDPLGVVTETSTANNSCSNTVTSQTADMIATKTNDVGGSTLITSPSWTWSVLLKNVGTLSKTFDSGDSIFSDSLPNTNISYDTPQLVISGVTGTGTLNCSINGAMTLNCTASGGTVTFAANATATVTFLATATASGTYANPRQGGGGCSVNGGLGNPTDVNQDNNLCSDTVVVTTLPELSVAKTNNVSGQSTSGGSWTWTFVVGNAGGDYATANFSNGQTILFDNLPDTGINYGAVGVATGGGTTGTVNCSIGVFNLTCTASGSVAIPAGGTITVTVPATSTTERIYANPRAGGVCSVDPGTVITEFNESNNSCANTVTSQTADMSATKTNNVGGSTPLTSPSWTWTFKVQNGGTLAKTFASGSNILIDNMPNTNIGYGTPNVSLNGSVSGAITCSISNFDLNCTANGSVVFNGGGIATITVLATATAAGTYANPRVGMAGTCAVSSISGTPSDVNFQNDLCSDTVIVTNASSSTSVSSSANPSVLGQSVTFTAVVTSASMGTITGTVTFKDGTTTLGTGGVSGGQATYTTNALSQGSHSITAVYGGDTNFSTSTSSPITQVVNAALTAPTGFSATASSTSKITLTWSTVTNATSYEIWHSSLGSAYTLLTTTPSTTLDDTSLTANRTYLYKVRAVRGDATSGFSPVDASTTIVFTDSTLSTSIQIKKTHIDELRTAVNAMRAAGSLSAATFTDSTITAQSTKIKAVHISELRTALDAARTAIGLPTLTYTDSTLTATSTKVKGAHITELRDGTQ